MSRAQTGRLNGAGGAFESKPDTVYTIVPADEQSSLQSLDKSTPPRTTWWYRLTLDTWIPEIIAVLISSVSTIAIAAILRYYDKKRLPELPWGITLNAIVSILATISRSMLVYTVSMSIGQLKWCWYYEKKRKLVDIQTMDAASRGPLGSIVLLVSLRARPLATIGAIITILALAFDPAVQQILDYRSRPVLQVATRPQVTLATAFPLGIEPSEWTNAIIAGVYSSADRFDRQLSCPSGNCTWPPYQSLGWCSKCQDATPYARIGNCSIANDRIDEEFHVNRTTCLIDFGHGLRPKIIGDFLALNKSTGGGGGRASPGYSPFNQSSFATELVWPLYALADEDRINTTRLGVYNPYLNLGHVTAKLCNGTVGSGICISSAQECVLTACETSLTSSFSNGTSKTVTTSTNFGSMSLPQLTSSPNDSEYCWERQANASVASNTTQSGTMPNTTTLGNCGKGRLSFWTIRALRDPEFTDILVDRLTGNWSQLLETSIYGSNQTVYPLGNSEASSDAMRYMKANGLAEVLEGVAASLTEFGLRANSSYTTTLEGEVWNTESYVSVSWHWLILPIVLVAGSVLLLTVASFHTYRCKLKLWKSSILPLLYRSLDRDLLDEQPVLRDAGAMATAAETASVKLAGTSRRDRTVLVAS